MKFKLYLTRSREGLWMAWTPITDTYEEWSDWLPTPEDAKEEARWKLMELLTSEEEPEFEFKQLPAVIMW